MSITVHQRPGVYSSYDASRVVSGSGAGRLVGLAGVNTTASAGVAQTITSYDQAVTAFGSSGAEDMAELIRLALANGASGVGGRPGGQRGRTIRTPLICWLRRRTSPW